MTATLTTWYEKHGHHEIFAGGKTVMLDTAQHTLKLDAEAVNKGIQTDFDDKGIAQEVPQSVRQAQHPLPYGHVRQDVICQMRRALRHASPATARTERSTLAGECDEAIEPAGAAPKPREAARQPPALQKVPECPLDKGREPAPSRIRAGRISNPCVQRDRHFSNRHEARARSAFGCDATASAGDPSTAGLAVRLRPYRTRRYRGVTAGLVAESCRRWGRRFSQGTLEPAIRLQLMTC